MGDRLVGADRAAELLAVFRVFHRHLQGPLRDTGRLGRKRHAATQEDRPVGGILGRDGVAGRHPHLVEANGVEPAGQIDRRFRGHGHTVGGALDDVPAAV